MSFEKDQVLLKNLFDSELNPKMGGNGSKMDAAKDLGHKMKIKMIWK